MLAPKAISRWWRVDGRRIHARYIKGNAAQAAPSVVMVPGLGASHRYFMPTAEELGQYLPVYVIDQPGFGFSDKPRHILGVPQLADALAHWIDVAGLDRPVLMGNSMGCQVIVDMASRYPEHLSAAILQGPTVDPEHRSFLRQFWRLIWNGRREQRRGLGLLLMRDYMTCGFRRYFRTGFKSLHDPIEQKLPAVTAPALVIAGSRDLVVPRRWAEAAAALLPKGRLVIVPGGAHTMNYSCPRQLRRLTLAFLHDTGLLRRPGVPSYATLHRSG